VEEHPETIVFATARRAERLAELQAEHPQGRIKVLAGDIGDGCFREALWNWAEAESGGVDLLINNAGIGNYADFATQDPAIVADIININVIALFDLTQLAIRSMRARATGEIVEISSVLGTFGIPYSAVYCATKHAVDGMVDSVRYELKGSGVNLWALRPGRFTSEFRQSSLRGKGSDHAKPGESVEAIARGLMKGLGGRQAFRMPTWLAAVTVALPHWLPGPFRWGASLFLQRKFAEEAGGAVNPDGSVP
jgi:hypothetical protein